MMHRAWSVVVEVPYCFSRSYVKFQGHTVLKIVEFDPNWAFPDCNSSLNSQMAMKCCTKLETAKERCPIVFQGHPSNFKVTRYKTSPILTQIGRFRTIGRSQLSNPSDLPCFYMKGYFMFGNGHEYQYLNICRSCWLLKKIPHLDYPPDVSLKLGNTHLSLYPVNMPWLARTEPLPAQSQIPFQPSSGIVYRGTIVPLVRYNSW